MKKIVLMAIASFALHTMAYAQNQPQMPQVKPEMKAEKTAVDKAVPKKKSKKAVKKMVVKHITGEVVNISTSTEKSDITLKIEKRVKGKKHMEEKSFSVDSKLLEGIKVGDKVKVKLVNGEVKKIKKHVKKEVKKEKKLKKQENKKDVKPAEVKTEDSTEYLTESSAEISD